MTVVADATTVVTEVTAVDLQNLLVTHHIFIYIRILCWMIVNYVATFLFGIGFAFLNLIVEIVSLLMHKIFLVLVHKFKILVAVVQNFF